MLLNGGRVKVRFTGRRTPLISKPRWVSPVKGARSSETFLSCWAPGHVPRMLSANPHPEFLWPGVRRGALQWPESLSRSS